MSVRGVLLGEVGEPLSDSLEGGVLRKDSLQVFAGHPILALGDVVRCTLGQRQMTDRCVS